MNHDRRAFPRDAGRRTIALLATAILATAAAAAGAQVDSSRTDNLPPDKGQLGLSTASLTLTSGNLEVRFIPLDERILRLITKDSYLSMERLLQQQQRGIDSVKSVSGTSSPGLAFVSFNALAPNTRFDPQLLTLTFHGQQYRPVGWVPLSPTFSNQQLDVREQVQAILLFQREIPVKEAFTLNYLSASTDAWEGRLQRFDSERSRILGSVRVRSDTSHH